MQENFRSTCTTKKKQKKKQKKKKQTTRLLWSSKDASNESITLVEDSSVVDNSTKTGNFEQLFLLH